MGHSLYRLIEHINGEKGLKLIPYSMGQKIKLFLLLNLTF